MPPLAWNMAASFLIGATLWNRPKHRPCLGASIPSTEEINLKGGDLDEVKTPDRGLQCRVSRLQRDGAIGEASRLTFVRGPRAGYEGPAGGRAGQEHGGPLGSGRRHRRPAG